MSPLWLYGGKRKRLKRVRELHLPERRAGKAASCRRTPVCILFIFYIPVRFAPMNSRDFKPITIVGGGLAGLSLGIGLRQRGIPVELFEAGKYPRHRVCGEFISGLGQRSLNRLGLGEKLISAGARVAKTTAFFSGKISSPKKNLPEPALCISRFALDNLLAEEFSRLGGQLHSSTRWKGIFGEGFVRATGRRRESVVAGWRYFGLKVHARNVKLETDLEMHFVENGYVGLCQLSHGEVNICGLFRSRKTEQDLANQWRDRLRGRAASALETRLAPAVFDENSFCSVAGLSLQPRCFNDSQEMCVGDSLTMIPPVTGNGMSMAFESAELAVGTLAEYSSGEISWESAQTNLARRYNEVFQARLFWARHLQAGLFHPGLGCLLLIASRFPGIWPAFFWSTR